MPESFWDAGMPSAREVSLKVWARSSVQPTGIPSLPRSDERTMVIVRGVLHHPVRAPGRPLRFEDGTGVGARGV